MHFPPLIHSVSAHFWHVHALYPLFSLLYFTSVAQLDGKCFLHFHSHNMVFFLPRLVCQISNLIELFEWGRRAIARVVGCMACILIFWDKIPPVVDWFSTNRNVLQREVWKVVDIYTSQRWLTAQFDYFLMLSFGFGVVRTIWWLHACFFMGKVHSRDHYLLFVHLLSLSFLSYFPFHVTLVRSWIIW